MGGGALSFDPNRVESVRTQGQQANFGDGGVGAVGTNAANGTSVTGGAGGLAAAVSISMGSQGGRGGDGTDDEVAPSGGGGGGAGYYSIHLGGSLGSSTTFIGGAGGNGGNMRSGSSSYGLGSGGGGGGGAGFIADASGFGLTLSGAGSTITGGAGGRGGDNTLAGVSYSGGGGGGGDGVLLFGADSVVQNLGTITGGVGGSAGARPGSQSSTAGASGAGIRGLNTGLSVNNLGTIRGGALTGNGAAGAGVITQGGATITNSGTIGGGSTGTGYASAVVFNGTANTLNLQAGSVIDGLVDLNENAAATIATTDDTRLNGVRLNGGTAAVRFDAGSASNRIDLNGAITGTGNVTSIGSGNLTLGEVSLTGALGLAHTGSTTLGGSINTSGAQRFAGQVRLTGPGTINSGSTINFDGQVSAMGTLSVTAGGDIAAAGAVRLNGASTFVAIGRDISLANPANFIVAGITATGRNINIAASTPLMITSVTATGNTTLTGPYADVMGNLSTQGTLTFNGGSAFQRAGTITAGTLTGNLIGDLSLSGSSNTIFILGNLTAGNVILGGNTPLTISGDVGVESISVSPTAYTTLTGTLTSNDAFLVHSVSELRVGTGGTTGTLNSDVSNAGTLVFNRADMSTFSYAVGGSGALIKRGAGTLQLEGNSGGFGGTTVVEAGRLVVGSTAGSSASLGGSDLTVNAGATLGGHGTLATNVIVQDGARLAPGNSIGTLTVTGDLQLQPGSILDFELGTPDPNSPFAVAGQGDSVVVGGNLSISDAALNITDGGGFGTGLYRLFTWGNTLALINGGFTGIPQGDTLQILGANRQINLIVPGDTPLQFWNANGLASASRAGGGSGVWSNTTPVWTDAQGTVTSNLSPNPGDVIFAGDAGTVTVSNSSGAVSARSLQFASDGYVLDGDALTLVADAQGAAPAIRVGDGSALGGAYTATVNSVITGSAGLHKTDLGTLVLTGANTWTGTTRIAGGALSIANESALGDAGNALLLDGGVLQVTGTALDRLQREVELGSAGGGFDIADASHTFVLDQQLTGTGALLKRGDGTLVVEGPQTYTGGTWVEGGVLQSSTDSLHGSIVNNASLVLAQDDDGTLAADVSGSGSLTKRGTGTVHLTGNNSYTGGTVIEAGTLQGSASSLRGALRNDGTLVLDRNEDSVMADVFTGKGSLRKTGSGTLVVRQAQGFSGTTQVERGTLVVGDVGFGNAVLGGSVTIGAAVRLQGIGRLGSLDLHGTLAPGNSIGTLQVSGNAVLQASSRYELEVDAQGRHDQLAVDGTTTILGGSVVSLSDGAEWNPLTRYTFITSQGGVTGSFASVSNNLAFLTPTLEYAPTSVTLALARNQVAFPAVGQTFNQRSTAAALESLGGGALYDRVVVMDAASAQRSFDAYSGELRASTQVTLLDDAARVRRTLASRLADARADTASVGGSTAGWAAAWGHWGHTDSDGNAARGNQQGTGWMAGSDLSFENDALVGVAIGQARSTLQVNAHRAQTRTNSKYASLYGRAGVGNLALRGGVSAGRSDNRLERSAVDQRLHANDDARLWQGFVDLAYGGSVGRVHLEPYLNYAQVRLEQRHFQEWGGDAALMGDEQTREVEVGTAGLRTRWHLDSRFNTSAVVNLGYQRAWGDTDSGLVQRFVAGGDAFIVNGLPVQRKAAVAEVGFTSQFTQRVEFKADYQGRFGSGMQDQGAQLTLRARF